MKETNDTRAAGLEALSARRNGVEMTRRLRMADKIE